LGSTFLAVSALHVEQLDLQACRQWGVPWPPVSFSRVRFARAPRWASSTGI